MLPDYKDIRKRLGDPIWFDDNGVPRYDPFHPDLVAIYADYVALLEIECQRCGKRFLVSSTLSKGDFYIHQAMYKVETPRDPELPTAETSGDFGFGDPPRHNMDGEGLCAGETMTCDIVAIREFWRRDLSQGWNWRRDPEHEITYKGEL